MLIKLSATCLAAVGAKTADEFPDKLVALLDSAKTSTEAVSTLTSKLADSEKSVASLQAELKANGDKITTLETTLGNPATMTESRIKTLATDTAKVEASRVAVEQIGAIGGAPATAAPVNVGAKTDAKTKSFPDLVAAQCAAGKTKADAVVAAIKEAPEAHSDWLKNGGGRL